MMQKFNYKQEISELFLKLQNSIGTDAKSLWEASKLFDISGIPFLDSGSPITIDIYESILKLIGVHEYLSDTENEDYKSDLDLCGLLDSIYKLIIMQRALKNAIEIIKRRGGEFIESTESTEETKELLFNLYIFEQIKNTLNMDEKKFVEGSRVNFREVIMVGISKELESISYGKNKIEKIYMSISRRYEINAQSGSDKPQNPKMPHFYSEMRKDLYDMLICIYNILMKDIRKATDRSDNEKFIEMLRKNNEIYKEVNTKNRGIFFIPLEKEKGEDSEEIERKDIIYEGEMSLDGIYERIKKEIKETNKERNNEIKRDIIENLKNGKEKEKEIEKDLRLGEKEEKEVKEGMRGEEDGSMEEEYTYEHSKNEKDSKDQIGESKKSDNETGEEIEILNLDLNRIIMVSRDTKGIDLEILKREAANVYGKINKYKIGDLDLTGRYFSNGDIYISSYNLHEIFMSLSDTDKYIKLVDRAGQKSICTSLKHIKKGNYQLILREVDSLIPKTPKGEEIIGEAYGIPMRDGAEKAQAYRLHMMSIYRDICINDIGINKLPSTIPAIGVKFMEKKLSEIKVELNNEEQRVIRTSDLKTEYTFTGVYPVNRENKDKRYEEEEELLCREEKDNLVHRLNRIARSAYKGGRNESYALGYLEDEAFFDVDLKSAYTSLLMNTLLPCYRDIITITNLDEYYKLHKEYPFIVGIVDFSFPEKVAFPNIAVRIDGNRGAIYPRSGRGFVHRYDIDEALRLGAEIRVETLFALKAKYQPKSKKEEIKPFEAAILEINKKRGEYEKGSMQNSFWKLIGNSIYGKVSQGIWPKESFSLRKNSHEVIGDSILTDPLIAGSVTSGIRNILSLLMNTISENGGVVYSCTTDGFVTNFDPQVLQTKVPITPLLEVYIDGVKRAYDTEAYLEIRHEFSKIFSLRTRGMITDKFHTLSGYSGSKQDYTFFREIWNKYIVKMTEEESVRIPKIRYIFERSTGILDYVKKGLHASKIIQDKSLSVRHDEKTSWKNPYNVRTMLFTTPYEDLLEYTRTRLKRALGFFADKPLKTDRRPNKETHFTNYVSHYLGSINENVRVNLKKRSKELHLFDLKYMRRTRLYVI